jgi:hypothetical protein
MGQKTRLGDAAFQAGRLANRVLCPFIAPRRVLAAAKELPWFLKSYVEYSRLSGKAPRLADLYPCLGDRVQGAGTASGDYFHQDLWAARKVHDSGAKLHVDVGSRVDGFVAHCSVFCKVIYVDLRPLSSIVHNITARIGSFAHLPFDAGAVSSLSSLHVVEHIGLGRYGDPIDPHGTKKALLELERILARDGNLYLGLPIGRERVEFNAHRITSPVTVLHALARSTLVDFSVIDKAGSLLEHCDPTMYQDAERAFGLFHFRKS